MAYSDFTLDDIKEKFQITIDEDHYLFSDTAGIAPTAWLTQTLKYMLPLALAIGTEKARSELIIAPMLVELRNIARTRISLFSGTEFKVDPAQGLTGFCDFIVSRSPEQLTLSAPVLIAFEAKKEDINDGMPQCMAAMLAAELFNQRKGRSLSPLYGAVTTGTNWRFLKLEARTIYVDQEEHFVGGIEKILGILDEIVGGDAVTADRRQSAAPQS